MVTIVYTANWNVSHFLYCCRSYLRWLEDSDPLEVSDNEVEDLGVQNAIHNSPVAQEGLVVVYGNFMETLF